MRHASGTIGPSKSAYSIADGAPTEPAFTVVRPSRSRTVASYSRFSIRRSCVVAGIPGAQLIVPPPPGSPPVPDPLLPPDPLALLPPEPDLLPPEPELELLFPPDPELPCGLPIDPVHPARPATRDPTRPNLARLLGIKRVMYICALLPAAQHL